MHSFFAKYQIFRAFFISYLFLIYLFTFILVWLLGTEEICRAFPDPNRLLFFSVHLYDRVSFFLFSVYLFI